jgi:hypothetical protein
VIATRMKAAGSNSRSCPREGLRWALFGMLFTASWLAGAPAVAEHEADSPAAAAEQAVLRTNTATKVESERATGTMATSSVGVAEIEQMVAAGVSKEVIQAFVENARVVRSLRPDEMISLKAHGVPDEITVALLKRPSQSRAEARANASTALPETRAGAPAGDGRLDPESYDFWWSHYAYPRVLSSSFQIAYPSPLGYYGWHGPFPGGVHGPFRDPRFGGLGMRSRSVRPHGPSRLVQVDNGFFVRY